MLFDSPTPAPAGPAAPSAGLLTDLVDTLAAVLRLRPDAIDPEQTFRSLGLDSLPTVEFVAAVNARHTTAIKADALFDHPTPLAFARHVARERGTPGEAPPAPTTPAPAPAPAPAAARPPGRAAGAVLDVLCEELARIVCCDPWDIDTTAAFHLLGVDSILGAQFVATVNRLYGLRERPATLYDHANLTAMAAHIAATAPAPAHSHVQVPASGAAGLGDLLDAVRDGRISVDEALGLLPRRS
ncbi:phosphopantetheine-binding protein [Streptomyces sp. NPDC002328]|uniref:phosphopantetheine-binding protein n=1 Tax=Streptomyces sp. NPDC002328 TaxID=3364642 RepID=UPI003697E35A